MSPFPFSGSLLESLRQSRLKPMVERVSWLHRGVRRAYYTAIRLNPFISPRYLYLGRAGYLDLLERSVIRLLPDFVVIGAQRCGTTSLHAYLDFHPDIFTSKPHKEPCLFLQDRPGKSDWKEYFDSSGRTFASREELVKCYMAQGYMGQRRFGEASTWYTMGYYARDYLIPQRMLQAVPGMKLVYLLRNPLERIVSHYTCGRRVQHFGSIDAFVDKDTHALLNSLYWFQLEEYLRHFPAERIKAILFEDLILSPGSVLDELCTFLDVPPFDRYPDFLVHNPSPERHLVADEDLHFDQATYDELMKKIGPDVDALARFLGRPLDEWDLSRRRWCRGS